MANAIAAAEEIVTKWDIDGSAYSKITSLFHDSRDEARAFILAVTGLRRAMNEIVSRGSTPANTRLLSRGHALMVTAMARLQKELHQILTVNRTRSDSDSVTSARSSLSSGSYSVDDEVELVGNPAMDDLRLIAECMLTCGYSKECVKAYTTVRRSAVEEGLFRLGHKPQSSTHVRKLEWEAAEKKIRRWVAASRPAIRILLAGEWFLCDYVFGSYESVKEAVFEKVAKEAALRFLQFPEMVSTKRKSSPEKIFHYLDLYESISELLPEMESLFSHRTTVAVATQARHSLGKVGEFVRSSLYDFEAAVQKDWTKGSVPGGGVHPLSHYVMNYLTFLSDYGVILEEILADHPFLPQKQLPQSFVQLLSPAPSAPSSPVRGEEPEPLPVDSLSLSPRLAWLILLLLGKINKKAELYGDAALSYLFLANNVRYAVSKVRNSNLRHLLGEQWVEKHEEKAQTFARGFEKLGWRKVREAIPEDLEALLRRGGLEAAWEKMAEFGVEFEKAYRRQSGWVVKDRWMRDELKVSIAGKVMVPYREFYQRYVELMRMEGIRVDVRFTPDDIGNYLSDLFHGAPPPSPSGSASSRSSVSRYESEDRSARLGMWRSA